MDTSPASTGPHRFVSPQEAAILAAADTQWGDNVTAEPADTQEASSNELVVKKSTNGWMKVERRRVTTAKRLLRKPFSVLGTTSRS